MDLAKKFEEATSCVTTNISSLDIEKTYPIVPAKRITTKYGPTVLLIVRDFESSVVQIFTPKRHCSVISDDMDKINNGAVSLNILHKDISETSKPCLLAIV